jgi:hypothetical protein
MRRPAFLICSWRGIVAEIHFLFPDLNFGPVNNAARLSPETVALLLGSS